MPWVAAHLREQPAATPIAQELTARAQPGVEPLKKAAVGRDEAKDAMVVQQSAVTVSPLQGKKGEKREPSQGAERPGCPG